MKIDGNTIYFRSTPDNYVAEEDWTKSNTIRFVDTFENGLIKGADMVHITIENTDTNESFTRCLSDHRPYDGSGVERGLVCWIFSF